MPTESRGRRRRRKLAAGAAVALGTALAPQAVAAVISVDSAADLLTTDGECTLREAVINANDDAATHPDCAAGDGIDDTIDFAGLTLPAIITLDGSIQIAQPLTIAGPGEADLAISGNGASRIFNIFDGFPAPFDVTISDLTLTGGFDSAESVDDGGAIHTEENLTLDAVTLTENVSFVSGGAVGAVGSPGTPVTLTITDSTITGNFAACCGGGINGDYAILDVANSTISGNYALSNGGGINLYALYGATIDETTISGNYSYDGGGLYFYGGTGDVTIEDSTISNNYAAHSGGGIFITQTTGAVVVRDTTISGNNALYGSAGVYLYEIGDATFERARIIDNITDGYAGGAGLWSSYVTITDSEVSGNQAESSAGLYAGYGTYLFLRNSTVAYNIASGVEGAAGGININNSSAYIELSTISHNEGSDAGNVFAYGSTVAINSTIIANGAGSTEPDLETESSTVTVDYSLIEDPTGATFTGISNITGQDPLLGTLQNNGGTTQTMKPQATSPVVGAGDPGLVAPPPFDQRGPGFPRIAGGRVDIGAVELQPGTLSLSATAYPTSEGAGFVTITVNRTGGSDGAVSVNYTTSPGSAAAGADYTTTAATLNWADGDTAPKTFDVPILEDNIFEGNEQFNVTLNTPGGGATLGTSAAVVTIADNDPLPTLTIDDVTQLEGTSFGFNVTLSHPSTQTVTVNFATSGLTATSGDDFTANSGMLTFDPLETSQPVTVNTLQDATDEPSETFHVTLTTPSNTVIADDTGVGTINDDDGAPALTIGDVTLAEGNAGTTAFVFNVNLAPGSGQTVTVGYTTQDGTATVLGNDYAANAGTLTFVPGDTSESITVLVNGDMAIEGNETFNVMLSNAPLATIDDATGLGTINNDDSALLIDDVTLAEGNAGATNFIFTVTLSPANAQTVTVQYTTQDGTATVAGNDYAATAGALTFLPGDTSEQIIVRVTGDTAIEPDETFTVVLSNAPLVTISDATGLGTINNDDTALVSDLSISKQLTTGGPFFVGQNVTFNLTVMNAGPDAAPNVTVTDTLPAGMTLVSASPGCTGTTTITCNVGPLAGNAQTSVTLTVQLTQAGTLTNIAAAAPAGSGDPTPASGSAQVIATPANAVVPTLSEWMLMALAGALAAIAAMKVKR
jgi:uncharacterized repeat protein (TIGR01451 family)